MEKKLPFTLEELIKKNEKVHQTNISRNTENIAKIELRLSTAEGEEKEKMQSLLSLHLSHKEELETIDPVAKATIEFEQLKQNV